VSAKELRFTTIMGIVAVTGVTFLLIPHWTAAIFVLPLISVLYLDLLGVLQWAGIHVNPVSYIALVLSIGLMVDFLMHLLLRFYESTGNRHEKTVETLHTMGAAIFLGALSTFLGTLPLAFSSSEIFVTIFVAFLGLVLLGCAHGLILLPVLLSIVGPQDQPLVQKPSSFRKVRHDASEIMSETMSGDAVVY
jgi:Niemann-Pick C1 protein